MAAGFSESELLGGAGIAQQIKKILDESSNLDLNWNTVKALFTKPPSKLDPGHDQNAIIIGIKLWKQYGED